MYAEAGRMRRLVEDLLVLSRLDEGRLVMHRASIEVLPFLQNICEQAQSLVHGQTLQCETGPDIQPVLADIDHLKQVLLNLIDNALKFTPPSGLVKITARSEHKNVVIIQVSDTGTGIPSEALPHVFDRFYRADSSRTRLPQQIGGNGLGLSIVKELVEAQDGHIAISSEVGVGTTVTIRLRATTPEEATDLQH